MVKKQLIKLTENDLYNIINESVKTLITESQESKSQSEAIKYLMQNMNWDKEKANNFVRNDLRQDIKWQTMVSEIKEKISRGVPYRRIFDKVGNFYDGWSWVKLNDKWNFINTNGEFISNQWFDDASDFEDGWAWVELNGKEYKFNLKDGKLYNITENKQLIRLTENKLKQIIAESVNKMLNENYRYNPRTRKREKQN